MADSAQAAIRDLQNKGLLPTQVVEGGARENARSAAKVAKESGGPIVKRGRIGKKLKLSTLVNFTQQMATLVGAGSQLMDSLKLIQKQATDPTLRKCLEDVISCIENGDSLSESMRKQKNMFPATMVSMIAAGESSGSLEKVLDRYGEYIQRQEELAKRFKTMLIYPSFIFGAAVCLIIGLIVFVIPKFAEFLEGMGDEVKLPIVTQLLIKMSKGTSSPVGTAMIVGGLVFAVLGVVLFMKSQAGKETWDRLRFKIPMFGGMAFQVMMARLAITLGTLIGSGVSIVPALLAVRDTLESHLLRTEMERIVGRIERGATLGETMEEGKIFPPLMIQVVRIGEEVGKLEELLTRIGNYFDREARNKSDQIMALIEPIMIVFMGLIVGGIVLAVILPILNATQSMGK